MRNGPYVLVTAPDDYPGKKYRGRYCYEHHLVWWQRTGEVPGEGFVVHHKNENKHDNRFKNLRKKTVAQHTSDHAKGPELVCMTCDWCNHEFDMEARNQRFKLKHGQERFYCCRSHQVKAQWVERRLHSRVAQ